MKYMAGEARKVTPTARKAPPVPELAISPLCLPLCLSLRRIAANFGDKVRDKVGDKVAAALQALYIEPAPSHYVADLTPERGARLSISAIRCGAGRALAF